MHPRAKEEVLQALQGAQERRRGKRQDRHMSGQEAERQGVRGRATCKWAKAREAYGRGAGRWCATARATSGVGKEGKQTWAHEKRRRAPRISARTSSGLSFGRSPTFSTFHVRASEVRT